MVTISGVGEMGVGETGVGGMGQIIGETGVGETAVGETGTSLEHCLPRVQVLKIPRKRLLRPTITEKNVDWDLKPHYKQTLRKQWLIPDMTKTLVTGMLITKSKRATS